MKKILPILIILLVSSMGYSQTYIQNNITYVVTSTTANTVSVTAYDNGGVANTDVVIPSTITVASSSKSSTSTSQSTTYTVTAIGFGAFDNKSISSVVIPNTVTIIQNNAFRNNSLTTVDLPDGLTTIGSYLFHQNSLTSINIPSNVTAIYPNAFSSNVLSEVTFSDSLTFIGSGSFSGNNLTNVTIPASVIDIQISAFSSNPITCVVSEATTPPNINVGVGGNSFSNIADIDLSIPSGTIGAYTTDSGAQWTGFKSVAEGLTGTFVVDNITYQINATPNNEVTITDYTNTSNTVLNIPSTVSSACTTYSVTGIGTHAFINNNLTSVTIPDSVTTIGVNAFRSNNLTNVILSNNLVSIGETAFAFNDISNITIPDSVINIDDGAFAQNNNMSSVIIGNSVTTIGEYAFRYNNLNSVTIPDSVTTIGAAAFSNNSLTNLDLGNGVTNIGFLAFGYNSLASVTIPASVTLLGDSVFNNNPLTAVYSEAVTPATITTGAVVDDTFYFRNNINLYIPLNTTATYVSAQWTGFLSVTEDASLNVSNYELAKQVKIATTKNEIKILSDNSLSLKSYSVYNISGIEVSKGKTKTIPTALLSRGIYILKLDFNKGAFIKKILID